MSQQIPDPARWLADLMKAQHTVLWPTGDIFNTSETLAAAATSWTKAVADLTAWQLNTMQQMAAPWTAALPGASAAAEPVKDKRFAGEAWSKDPRFDALARTYLAQTEQMRKALEATPLDERSKAQWGFALGQLTDALSPANMLVTNPEALQLAMETGGASLAEGLRLFTEDLARGRIAMTDETAFEVGRNVGTTPGSVIYQNELMQLIQYSPTTDTVHRRPLVIVPPCINKYYILDLQPQNSFIAHAVAQHHTVFLVSWRNAGPGQATLTWDDYIEHGVLRAIDVARRITKADTVNTLGFCVGGTLLASAVAVQAARGEHPASRSTSALSTCRCSSTPPKRTMPDQQELAAACSPLDPSSVIRGRCPQRPKTPGGSRCAGQAVASSHLPIYHPYGWSGEGARMAQGESEKTEKITINLGLVDLGQIDLLVQEGFYTNRTDFIRTAIRTQLAARGEALDQTAARRTLTLGSRHYTRRDLEEIRDAGQMIHIRVLGLASIAADVSPQLALATIASVEVLGAFRAPAEVKAVLTARTV
jgi:Arc/MetJ-type ribon-helix-helix transcriptional regulator